MTSPIITSALAMLLSLPANNDRVQRYAIAIGDAVEETGADPFALIALGWHESALDESAMSSAGAWGPFQILHRFNADILDRCRINPDVCLRAQAVRAAELWIYYAKRCPGAARSVRAYRSGMPGGRCLRPRARDVEVVRTRNKLARFFSGST